MYLVLYVLFFSIYSICVQSGSKKSKEKGCMTYIRLRDVYRFLDFRVSGHFCQTYIQYYLLIVYWPCIICIQINEDTPKLRKQKSRDLRQAEHRGEVEYVIYIYLPDAGRHAEKHSQ